MNGTKKILVVDDDDALRGSLAEQLQLHEEFSCASVASGTAGLDFARAHHVDLVLLDVGLPDMDGREVCRLMRKAGIKVPIVMLTGADTDSDTILGLDAGANDYVAKPFRFGVLLARIRAHLRSHEQSEDAIFKIGPYSFRPSAKILVDGQEKKIRLTEKETSILKYLYRAGSKVVGRDTLLAEVWGFQNGLSTHTVETHIYRLRQKVKRLTNKNLILTNALGYSLSSVP